MAKAFEARLAAAERILNPPPKGPTLVYILGGCRYSDKGPFNAHGEGREWESAPGESFEAFRARVQHDAVGVRFLIFGGLPAR